MKIQLKRSSVLENGLAKEPTVSQVEYGELCVNYNTSDPCIFVKDSTNNIIRIAGAGAPGGGGDAGDGLESTNNADNTTTLSVLAEPGKGIAVSSSGVSIGDDWSSIPTLP